MKFFYLALLSLLPFALEAQERIPKSSVINTSDSEEFVRMLDETLMEYYKEIAKDKNADSIYKLIEDDSNIGDVSDEEYCKRLEKINEISPFHLDCNSASLSTLKFFVKNRRGFAKIVLGRSKLYFDLYEQTLAKYDMPIELKYLSVIESGLRPQVKSRAGALGLWQFMYATGKMYGLNENSYIDERMDPVKATDAACRYLKKLHDIYGDWNLALAAYNAGPGNVNKAIRRSGGKRTYWEVRPFLPRETQGYVPNFIAATYLLTYHKEHNIKPAPAKIHYYQLDTICLSSGVHMATIEKLIGWEVDDIVAVNPIYKQKYIPKTEPFQCISGPITEIGKLVQFGDSLAKLEKSIYNPDPILPELEEDDTTDNITSDNTISSNQTTTTKEIVKWHKVKRGETLSSIANKYDVTISDIQTWNHLRGTVAPLGRNLKIIHKITTKHKTEIESDINIKDSLVFDSIVTIYHTVTKNESLPFIAEKYHVSEDSIKKWNKLNSSWLSMNQKLLVKVPVKLKRLKTSPKEIKPTIKTEPKSTISYYKIKPGDRFFRIAEQHGLSMQELKELNPKVNPENIRVGETLRVR